MTKTDAKDSPRIEAEFYRPVDVATIGARGRHYKLEAAAPERRALAVRFGIISVERLVADCVVSPVKKGTYRLTATFEAALTQACGVSLEPIAEEVRRDISVTLVASPRGRRDTPAVEFEFDEEDFEILDSSVVDIGEIIAQHLSLEIPPYPRKVDATGKELGVEIIQEEDIPAEPGRKNPFAVLKSLKHKT